MLPRSLRIRAVAVLTVVVCVLLVLLAFDSGSDSPSGQRPESAHETAAATADDLVTRAEQLPQSQQGSEFRELIGQALALDPNHPKAILYQASFLQEDGQSDQALEILGRIGSDSNLNSATARYLEGRILLSRNQSREAAIRFRASTGLNPRYAAPWRELARRGSLHLKALDTLEALRQLRLLRPLSTGELTSRLLAGRPVIDSAHASDVLNGYLSQDQGDVESVAALVRYALCSNEFQEARRILDARIPDIAGDAHLKALTALTACCCGDRKTAEALLENLPLNNESPLEFWILRGRLATESSDWSTSLGIHEYLLQRNPNDVASSHAIAVALDRLGRTDQAARQHAVTDLLDQLERRAFEMLRPQAQSPQMALPVMLQISDLLERLRRDSEAADWLFAASQMNPEDAGIRQRLVRLESLPPDRQEPAGVVPVTPVIPEFRRTDSTSQSEPPSAPAADLRWRFTDVAKEVGLTYEYHNGRSPTKRIIETVGGGSCVLDFDADSWPDLCFPQGRTAAESGAKSLGDKLFRNLRGREFADCTAESGILELQHSLASTSGDFDNDGFADLFVSNVGVSTLFRNLGDGTFEAATTVSMKHNQDCSSCAAFTDLNQDGLADLFVVNYVRNWDRLCRNSDGDFATCDPKEFEGGQNRVYQNQGNGEFSDVTATAGIMTPSGRGLGILVGDFCGDTREDVCVANDGTPNFLFENVSSSGEIRFHETAKTSGVAVSGDGRSRAGMGIAAADFDNNGFADLFVTNFYREPNTLYAGLGGGIYADRTRSSGLDEPSLEMLGFGTQAIDVDRNGDADLVVLNGDIDDYSRHGRPWKMRTQVFRNDGSAHFSDVSGQCGPFFDKLILGRGLTRIDFDGDFRDDLVAVRHDGPVALLRNETDAGNPVVRIRLISEYGQREASGIAVNRDAAFQSAPARMFRGDGFSASNERILALVFPVGTIERNADIRWPDGTITEHPGLAEGSISVIVGRNSRVSNAYALPR